MLYLILINAAAWFLMLIDKRKAQKQLFRIPEKVLLGIGMLGGSLGSICGMVIFRHKTRKPLFAIGLPVILLLQIGILLYSWT